MADDLSENIKDNATNPAKAEVDGVVVEQQPISNVIDADRYLASKKAVKKKGFGLRFQKIAPPGPID